VRSACAIRAGDSSGSAFETLFHLTNTVNMEDVSDPILRFQQAFDRAARNAPADHTAMALATADPATGRPAVRIVLLHGFDERGFVFYTNYDGRKAADLEANPQAALCFYWPWLDEQVRAEGPISRISEQESDAYFTMRARGKQLAAWASLQSQPLASRGELLARYAEAEARYAGEAVPRPPFWGGYRLSPERIEFWKAGDMRLHDRWLYLKEADGWRMTRLYP
jgi:pyridoxamine 5'-phosphate oxidase